MVSIRAEGRHIGGGGLISHQHVLTAAHIFFDGYFFRRVPYEVSAGILDEEVLEGLVAAKVEAIYIPVQYSSPKCHNSGNIAVLKVDYFNIQMIR